MEELVCFTDGSALSNKQNAPAGWACYFPSLKKLFSKGMLGTNNQAELTAISFGLYYALTKLKIKKKKLIIKTDSEYSIKVIQSKNKPKLNEKKVMNCRKLILELKKRGNEVEFSHVSAHTGASDFDSLCNDIVDKKAREKAKGMKRPR